MAAVEPIEILNNLPEDTKQIVLAYSVMQTRIESLDRADREDLFQLMLIWSKSADDDERKSASRAMIEILTQRPLKTKPLAASDRLRAGSKSWAVHVGRTIRTLREKADLTQEQLAERAGLPQSHISRLENAAHTATNLTLTKIAKALGVQLFEIDPCAE